MSRGNLELILENREQTQGISDIGFIPFGLYIYYRLNIYELQ